MTLNITEVSQGTAEVWIAPYVAGSVEALPDETTVAAGEDWGGNWEEFAYIEGAITIQWNDEVTKWRPQQLRSPLLGWRKGFAPTFKFMSAQISGEVYARVFSGTVSTTAAGVSQVGYEELAINPPTTLNLFTLGFETVNAESGFATRYHIPKVAFQIDGDLTHDQQSDTVIAMGLLVHCFQVDKDTAPAKYQRVTAAATA